MLHTSVCCVGHRPLSVFAHNDDFRERKQEENVVDAQHNHLFLKQNCGQAPSFHNVDLWCLLMSILISSPRPHFSQILTSQIPLTYSSLFSGTVLLFHPPPPQCDGYPSKCYPFLWQQGHFRSWSKRSKMLVFALLPLAWTLCFFSGAISLRIHRRNVKVEYICDESWRVDNFSC